MIRVVFFNINYIMKIKMVLSFLFLAISCSNSFTTLGGDLKTSGPENVVQVMTLGVFHFAYPNLDAVKTSGEDQISVLDEPWQTQILAIARAISEFSPTIIAVEFEPEMQPRIDELYSEWRAGKMQPRKNEVYQLGFRIGKMVNAEKIWCVDNPGKHYTEIEAIFGDKERMAKFENFFFTSPKKDIIISPEQEKVKCIIHELIRKNDPESVRQSLAAYLVHPFGYEEETGDFTGVDFESGRWYNRNLRIFRNIQRIPANSNDRILLIVGSSHLNLLNIFFDISPEYRLVSPLPYLDKARTLQY
jgi:hypothetical protein